MPWRWLILLSCLVVSGCSPAADAPPAFSFDRALRPPAAGFGEVVATVHLFRGSVQVRAANLKVFPARPGCPLLRGDSLLVGQESFVVLHLRNNRLTRIEANQEMKLSDVALLDAAPSEVALEQQLTSMLSAEERAEPERIVGWHARKSAALTVGTEKEEALRAEKAMRDVAQVPEKEIPREEKKSDEGAQLYAHRSLEEFGAKAAEDARQADEPAKPKPEAKLKRSPAKDKALEEKPSTTSVAGADQHQPPALPPAPSQPAPPPPAAKPDASPPGAHRAKAEKKVAQQGLLKMVATKGGDGEGGAVAGAFSSGGGEDLDEALRGVDGLAVSGGDRADRRGVAVAGGKKESRRAKANAPMPKVQRVEDWLLRTDGKWHRQRSPLFGPLLRMIRGPQFARCLGLSADQEKLPRVLTVELIYRDGALSRLVILALPSQSQAMACLKQTLRRVTPPKSLADADLRILVRLR